MEKKKITIKIKEKLTSGEQFFIQIDGKTIFGFNLMGEEEWFADYGLEQENQSFRYDVFIGPHDSLGSIHKLQKTSYSVSRIWSNGVIELMKGAKNCIFYL